MLDSVIRKNKKYCPQTLFEEYKYEIKKNKMENFIIIIIIINIIIITIIITDFTELIEALIKIYL